MDNEPEWETSYNDGFLKLSELGATILSSVIGYRQLCLEAGFSDTASEIMAVEYHKYITTIISNPGPTKT